MPVGSYFDLVSCPNQFFEVLVYLFLYVILWGNKTWPFVTLWVVVNQVILKILNYYAFLSRGANNAGVCGFDHICFDHCDPTFHHQILYTYTNICCNGLLSLENKLCALTCFLTNKIF